MHTEISAARILNMCPHIHANSRRQTWRIFKSLWRSLGGPNKKNADLCALARVVPEIRPGRPLTAASVKNEDILLYNLAFSVDR